MKKDRLTRDEDASPWKAPAKNATLGLHCDLCNESLVVNEQDDPETVLLKKNHYLRACRTVIGTPVLLDPDKSTSESIKRMAQLGLTKRLGKAEKNFDRLPVNSSSISTYKAGDNFVSIQEEPPD